MPDLLLYPHDEFADFLKAQAKALGVSLAKLVREAAERQLAKGGPLPPIAMVYTDTARISTLRVRVPAGLLKRIEADAERQDIKLHHWIEVAAIVHCEHADREAIKAHREAIRAHEQAIENLRDQHAGIGRSFRSFENHGGWPGVYERLKARATA